MHVTAAQKTKLHNININLVPSAPDYFFSSFLSKEQAMSHNPQYDQPDKQTENDRPTTPVDPAPLKPIDDEVPEPTLIEGNTTSIALPDQSTQTVG